LDDQLPANQIVLRLITNRPGYSRRVSLDLYDGTTWKRSAPTRGVAFRKDAGNIFNVGNANALLVPSDCPTVRIKQQITIDVDRLGKFLPVYWTPQAMSGIFETITVQEDGSLKVQKSLETGKSYQAISLLPIYKVSHMRNLPERTSSHFESGLSGSMLGRKEMEKAEQALMDKYRQLPDTVPEKVRKLAVKIAGKDGNWFVKAERISGYLSKNFKFAQGKPERMSDGDFVYNFLYRTRQGNCIEFASAFVVMCRAAGIPARLVSGYLPGKLNKTTGFYEVKAKDGHCWGEIYLPNWSWVPFDASPLSSYPESEEENNWLSSLAEMGLANPFGGAFQSKPSESAGAGLGQGISGSELEKQLKELADGKKTEDAKKPDAEKTLAEHLADFRWEPILILFLLGATLYILNAVTRKSDSPKVESLPQNAKKSTLIFLEVLRDLKRYKIVRIPTDTPGDLAARIHSAFEQSRQEGNHVHKELEPLISQFMEVYHLDRFGRSDRVSELESMSAQIRVLVKSKPDK
ncbi:MAG: DUF3488 and transglutaminase-like domain-containing protein, partial [Candidatus Obscuribacterales bacterium]|nr:DUF3488 and transglutaminase-like domain-containing protein [Candidatus Obscuribacterales bacterium]